jgi:hypothetical protein
METYVDEKHRRIEQFAAYLRLMGQRRHKVVKGDSCFIIFDDSFPQEADAPRIKESVAIAVPSWRKNSSAGGDVEETQPRGGPKETCRFIQFVFMRDCFYLDLPNNTVFPNEAAQIFRQRRGFYYARKRSDLVWVRVNWRNIVRWNPLQKIYLYRDEESAAEDMAFILFQVWKFPVDWRWYVTAAAFRTGHRFEQGRPLA